MRTALMGPGLGSETSVLRGACFVTIVALGIGLGSGTAVLAQGGTPANTPASPPKLEIVLSEKPHFKLKSTVAAEQKLTVRNVSGGDLKSTGVTFAFQPDASGAKVNLQVPRVEGWQGTTLKDKDTTDLWISFPAYDKSGDYTASLTVALDGTPPTTATLPDVRVTIEEPAVTGTSEFWADFWVIAVAVIVFVIAVFVRGKAKHSFLQSPDGDYSVSRFQVMTWVIVVAASFVYIYLLTGKIAGFPDSVLYLMGISGGSLAGAKVLANSKDQSLGGGVAPTVASTGPKPLGQAITSMLSDDDNQPSTMRFQLFVWTIVSALIFLRQVWGTHTLWDVPTSLLVLMGISHAGYLVDKGASADSSMKVQSVQPPNVVHDTSNKNPAATLVIVGLNFNLNTAVYQVMVGGQKLTVTNATASQLTVSLPAGLLGVGQYDVVVQAPGQDAEVSKNAFEVK